MGKEATCINWEPSLGHCFALCPPQQFETQRSLQLNPPPLTQSREVVAVA